LASWTTTSHSFVPLVSMAEEPEAEKLTAGYEKTHAYDVMKERLL
jgi:hypothetical protein